MFLVLFLAANILSTVFSIDRHTSIFGYYSRFNGGLLSIAAFIILYFGVIANLNRLQAKKVIFFSLISAFLVAVWGIPSHFGLDFSCWLIVGKFTPCWQQDFNPTLRIFSTLGQPNWLAAFLVITAPGAWAFLIASQKIKLKLFFWLISSVMFLALIFTNSRAGIAAFAISVTVFLILLIIGFAKKTIDLNWKTQGLWIGSLVVAFALIFFVFGQFLLGRVTQVAESLPQQPTSPSGQTAIAVGGTESGKIRLIVWKGAIEIFKHYPITGSGVETFAYSYYQFRPTEHNQTTEWNFLYNKAHNEFLNYLATTGAAGIVSYLLFIGVFLFLATFAVVKKTNNSKNKLLAIGLISGFVGNLAANFFGFSVVATNLLFFLIPAATCLILGIGSRKEVKISFPSIFVWLATTLVILGQIGASLVILRFFLADIRFAASSQTFSDSALIPVVSAVEISPVSQPEFLSQQALIAAQVAVNQTQDHRESLLKLADESIKKALQISPANLNSYQTAVTIYSQYLSQIDPKYNQTAIELAGKAALLAPTDPTTQYNLAVVLANNGQKAEAVKILEKTIELKPDYQPALEMLETLNQN